MLMVHHQLVFHHVNVIFLYINKKFYILFFKETPNQPPVVPNYLEQLQDLTPVEQQGVNAFMKAANEDSKANVVQAVKNYRIFMKNEYECPPIGVREFAKKNVLILYVIDYRLQRFVEKMEVGRNFIHQWTVFVKL